MSRGEFPPVTAEGEGELDFDLNSTVFTGNEMLQKFTSKSVYDRCFKKGGGIDLLLATEPNVSSGSQS